MQTFVLTNLKEAKKTAVDLEHSSKDCHVVIIKKQTDIGTNYKVIAYGPLDLYTNKEVAKDLLTTQQNEIIYSSKS